MHVIIFNVRTHRIHSLTLSGPEAEAHGRAAAERGVGPGEQAPDRVSDRPVGREPGATLLRAVQAQVLHGIAAERGAAESEGETVQLYATYAAKLISRSLAGAVFLQHAVVVIWR